MTYSKKHFCLTSGDSLGISIKVTDNNDNPKDLTNIKGAYWSLKQYESDFEVSKELNKGINLSNNNKSILQISLEHSDTEGVFGNFYHLLEVIDAAGNISIVSSGRVVVNSK